MWCVVRVWCVYSMYELGVWVCECVCVSVVQYVGSRDRECTKQHTVDSRAVLGGGETHALQSVWNQNRYGLVLSDETPCGTTHTHTHTHTHAHLFLPHTHTHTPPPPIYALLPHPILPYIATPRIPLPPPPLIPPPPHKPRTPCSPGRSVRSVSSRPPTVPPPSRRPSSS